MFRLTGLIAAVFTPLKPDGSLAPDQVGPIVEGLLREKVGGLFVCGSTGEGPSLSTEEREATAAAYIQAAAGRIPVVVQVGHSSIAESKRLARHAREIGADAVSTVAPSYFKPTSVENLIDCLAEIAQAAGDLPFYYYHIPGLTGVDLDPLELLRRADDRLPSLRGIKYTTPEVDTFAELVEFDSGRFDILFGRDQMLLSGLTAGATGAIGSTYNFAAGLYHPLMAAFERGDLPEARRWQSRAVAMIHLLLDYGGAAAFKAVTSMLVAECGPVRLPLESLSLETVARMKDDLEKLGFFDWLAESDRG